MVVPDETIDSLLKEKEQYPPPESFRANAWIRDERIYEEAARDPIKGQAVVAYGVLRSGEVLSDGVAERLRQHVRREIGSIAVPDEVYVTSKLPKTRSGKIMRRVLRAVVSGQEIGDTTTLEDPGAVDEVRRWLAKIEERRS